MAGTRSATGNVKLNIAATIVNTFDSGAFSTATIGKAVLGLKLTNGIDAEEINRAWESQGRALASGASETLDLYDLGSVDVGGGAGRDALGQLMTMREVVVLSIQHISGSGRLEINSSIGGAYATWVPVLTVANDGALKAGGVLLMLQPDADAFLITDGASHTVHIKANGGSVVYDIIVIGRHDNNESSSSSSQSSSVSSSSASSLSSVSSSSVSSLSSVSSSSLSSSSSSP